jgi:hypothetical protein
VHAAANASADPAIKTLFKIISPSDSLLQRPQEFAVRIDPQFYLNGI